MQETIEEYVSIWDFEPQIVDEDFGTEPSMRELLMSYYMDGGFTITEASDLTNKYMEEIDKNY